MKILAISDTHGKLNKVRDIYKKLTDIDLIIHAGDFMPDGEALEKEFNVPVIAVKGNCDGSRSEEDFEIVETEYGNILVTHGHMEKVKMQLNSLMYKTMEHDCKAVVFGHTHKSGLEEHNGIYFINPGSLTRPRDGTDGSYAIIRTSEDRLDASIVYYSTVMKTKSPTKTGFLRNIMNFSDRL